MSSCKLRLAQPSATATSARERGAQPADLLLECADNATVLVSSSVLLQATASEAIVDIIALLREQKPSAKAPVKWQVSPDKATVWEVVWKMVQAPMALAKHAGLTWVRVCGRWGAITARGSRGPCAPSPGACTRALAAAPLTKSAS